LTAAAASPDEIAGRCLQPEGRCVALLSADCQLITGDALAEDSILIGSQLVNDDVYQQQSAVLAIEEINSAFGGGGIPRASKLGPPRPLAMLSCTESTLDPVPAARHLIEDLQVPAMLGPNLDQDAINVTTQVAAAGNTVMMSPSSLIDSLGDLPDNNMTWRDTPSGGQISPLFFTAYVELEAALRQGNPNLRLGIVYRDDAFGQNAIAQISKRAPFNGKPLSDQTNASVVRISKYPPGAGSALATLVGEYQADPPDFVMVFGGAESITGFVKPLEIGLGRTAGPGIATGKPAYLLFETAKVTALLDLLDRAKTPEAPPDLRSRIRGVGLTPTSSSQSVYDEFGVAFTARYGGNPNGSGMGQAYDAIYAFAFALSATAARPPSGESVADGLARISAAGADATTVGRLDARQTLGRFASGDTPRVIGTFGDLRWDARGDYVTGRAEVWCVGLSGGAPYFASASVSMDIELQMISGAFTPCPVDP
jgi:branched-chain amino acid transport system substrate-binding protein